MKIFFYYAILFFMTNFYARGTAIFDIGSECYESELNSLRVLSNSKLKGAEDCFLGLSCTPKIYAAPFYFSCNGSPVFISAREDVGINSLAVKNNKLYVTKFTKDRVGSELQRLSPGEKNMESIHKTKGSYLYLQIENSELKLYEWLPSKCSKGTFRRKFWQGCFKPQILQNIKLD